ncbi:hypothetical protein BDF20DRAFT_855071, partial [Mycotypha africana]|uniref:uncharacterized protein n=1 Tax=Mycotypha africana TaxID=64632 RepID=UPI002300A818
MPGIFCPLSAKNTMFLSVTFLLYIVMAKRKSLSRTKYYVRYSVEDKQCFEYRTVNKEPLSYKCFLLILSILTVIAFHLDMSILLLQKLLSPERQKGRLQLVLKDKMFGVRKSTICLSLSLSLGSIKKKLSLKQQFDLSDIPSKSYIKVEWLIRLASGYKVGLV